MKRFILTSLLLCGSLLSSDIPSIKLPSTEITPTKSSMSTRSSILQTDIAPYLESQDTNVQTDKAELLLNDTAIPDASAIDTTLANLFSLEPCSDQCSNYNPNDPLVDLINKGLIKYLQASLAKLDELHEITKIAAGGNHTVVLTSNGKVYATGENALGQLGIGTYGDYKVSLTPMLSPGDTGVTDIAAGKDHTIVLKNDKAYATGNNTYGQLGIGTSGNDYDYFRTTLTPMLSPGDTGVTAIAGGENHSVILKNSKAYTVGSNEYGQLGINISGGGDFRSTLTEMINGYNTNITAITAGDNHTVVLNTTGNVYGAGNNDSNQLSTENSLTIEAQLAPMVLNSDNTPITDITHISAGNNHTVVLNSSEAVYATGANSYGQLGIDDTNDVKLSPMVNPGDADVIAIAAGGDHTVVLKNDGTVYATGANSSGQLGVNDTSDRLALTQMFTAGTFSAIAAGGAHTVVLKKPYANSLSAEVYATGSNSSGQLGINNITSKETLTEIAYNAKLLQYDDSNAKVMYLFNLPDTEEAYT